MKNSVFTGIALAVVVVLMTIPFFTAGCATGVSEADYNAMKTELQTTKAELETLKAQGTGNAKVAIYAEINDRCIDVWRVLGGEPSKYGYMKGEVAKWIADMDAKISNADDVTLTTMWKSYISATPGQDQNKKAIALMSYVSDKLKTLTAK
ncbi:MAG: hypothetical protein NTZ34_06690 [Chloroflexi bacterium]|nr:hypothetical protein [Chloroflexota bacterium]